MASFIKSLFFFSFFYSLLEALPQNPQIKEGAADVILESNQITIDSTHPKTIIHWDEFSLKSDDCITFSADTIPKSDIINVVTTQNASWIQGCLHAASNCRVLLVNTNGINLAVGSGIYAHHILFSTLPLTHFDPNNEWIFQGNQREKLVINGDIQGSEITFVGFLVEEGAQGIIKGDRVNIGAGAHVVFKPNHSERIFIAGPALHTAAIGADIKGKIEAVSVSIKADGSAYSLAINHEGIIQATGCDKVNDRILLLADPQGGAFGGGIKLNGTIERDCSICDGVGPSVEVRGVKIVGENGHIKAHGGDVQIGGNRLVTDRNGIVAIDENVGSDRIDIKESFPISSSSIGANDPPSTITIEARQSVSVLSVLKATTRSHGSSRINILSGNQLELLSRSINLSSLNDFGTLNIKSGNDLYIATSVQASTMHSHIKGDDLGSYLDYANCSITSNGDIFFKDLVIDSNPKTIIQLSGKDLNIAGKSGILRQNGGSIDMDFSQNVNLKGGSVADSISRLETFHGDIKLIFGRDLQVLGGSGARSDGYIKARTIAIDARTSGVGNILVGAGSCASGYIHSKLGTIDIGKKTQISDLTIEGGKSGSNHLAYIGNPTGHANIAIDLNNNLTLESYGGSGNSARMISNSGLSLIDITCKDLALKAGVNPTSGVGMLSFAAIENPQGLIKIKAHNLIMTSSDSSHHKEHYTEIVGNNMQLDIGHTLKLTGGNAYGNHSRIYGKNGVDIVVDKECTLRGSYAPALILADSGYISIEPSSTSSFLEFKANSANKDEHNDMTGITMKKGDVRIGARRPLYSFKLQAGGNSTSASKAHISVIGHGNIDIHSKDISLSSGSHTSAHAQVHIGGKGRINVSSDNLHLAGKCEIPNNASIIAASSEGHVTVDVVKNIVRIGATEISGGGSTQIDYVTLSMLNPCDSISDVCCPAPISSSQLELNSPYFFELFYRMRYFGFYDWHLLHAKSLWNEADYTAP